MKHIGEKIIESIVTEGLVTAPAWEQPATFVWKAESAEMIEEVVRFHLSQSDLVKKAYEICQDIEKLGGSTEQSNLSVKASNLARELTGLLPPHNPDALTLGQAIQAMKDGKHVARHGWNGKSMRLFLLPGGEVPKSAIHDSALRKLLNEQVEGDTFQALPSIRMFTADKKILTGWLASQTDLMADDYYIIKE